MKRKLRPTTPADTGVNPREDPAGNFTTAPVEAQNLARPSTRPEFIRLAAPGQKCPYTGLSRSGLNSLVLPTAQNRFKPPVRSFVLRRPGAKTGVRLIDYEALVAYVRNHLETGANDSEAGA
jgi:hypothetical protein